MPPRRILFVNHVARVSGAERSLLDLLRHLDRERFQPMVALPPGGELWERLKELDVPCHPLPLRRLRKTANPFRLAGALANVVMVVWQLARLLRRKHIALVHANSNTAQVYAGPAARLCGIACVWHTRDLVALGPLGRWMGRRASCIVAISDCVRRQIDPCIEDPAKVVTIRHGIDIPVFAPRGKAGPAPVFGMIGQLVPWKRHDAFIETAARLAGILPDARFVLVGADLFGEHPAYRTRLETRLTELGLGNRLLFTGCRPEVSSLLGTFDVLIHPASREPLGRVVLEAMALGIPVVAVNACGPSEIIRHEQDGLLTATNRPEELADAALRLIRDPLLAARLVAAARKRIEQDFNIAYTVLEIEALYDKLLREQDTSCA